MPDVKFVDKLVGAGEKSIKELKGFRTPSQEEHFEILNVMEKRQSKKIVVLGFYTVICLLLTVLYIYLSINSKSSSLLFIAAIFGGVSINNIYILTKAEKILKNIIRTEKYEICIVKIHHLMPTFGTGRQTGKICDSDGTVYSYEFLINRKLKKRFKKEPERDVFVLKISEKEYVLEKGA